MKTITMQELKVNDIFCHELKLHGREAFIVNEVKKNSVICTSRKTSKCVKKSTEGMVILLNGN